MPTETQQTLNDNVLVYPQYEKNCISNIPTTILNLFNINTNTKSPLKKTTQKVDDTKISKIILLVIDGFGFNQFTNLFKENKFLTKLASNGEVSPLTSVFPTQTTNALTTLNTGLTPQEHGLFEYFIYLKDIGVVNALRFERIDSKQHSKLVDEGFNPRSLLLKGKSIHCTLKEEDIRSFVHMHISNAFNACSKLIFQGSTVMPALKTSDLIVRLRKNLQENNGDNAYFFVHIDSLDTVSHEYGPQSVEYGAELSAITYMLNRELVEKIDPETARETLLLMTADHGAVQVNPNETTYLNLHQKPFTSRQIAKNRKRILPTGSPRDIFLHITTRELAETKEELERQIGDKAQVVETEDAIKDGLFGVGKPSREFLERTGNLLILPYKRETVWFANQDGRKISFLGQHGGLNAEEMLVPFAVVNLNRLKN